MSLKISAATLVTTASRSMKMPTGESGDKAINAGQIADLANRYAEANVSGAPINLDFASNVTSMFNSSGTIGSAKTIALTNATNAKYFRWAFTLVGTPVLTLPATFLLSDVRWNASANEWTPIEAGTYLMEGFNDGTNWIVKISDAPFV